MLEKNQIRHYGQLFQAISLYLEIDFIDCKEDMLAYMLNNKPSKNSDTVNWVNDAWEGRLLSPKKATLETYVSPFFKELAKKRGKTWKNEWVTTPIKSLSLDHEPLNSAVQKILQPIALARLMNKFYQSNTNLLSILEEDYCKKYFYIYRIHSKEKMFVRDLLRIQSHDGLGNVFCNLYQYSEQSKIKNKKYEGIRVYSGNVFINSKILDINLVSDIWKADIGLRFCKIVFPRMGENLLEFGIMTALSDHEYVPASTVIAITEADIEHPFKGDNIQDYVKDLTDNKISEEYREILDRIDGKYIDTKKEEKIIFTY